MTQALPHFGFQGVERCGEVWKIHTPHHTLYWGVGCGVESTCGSLQGVEAWGGVGPAHCNAGGAA